MNRVQPNIVRVLRPLLAALVLLVAACDDDPSDPGPFELGVYDLVSINGVALPVITLASATDTTWLDEGRLVFSPDSTVEAQYTFTLSHAGEHETFEAEVDGLWGTTPANLVWVQFPGDFELPPPDTLLREPDVLILDEPGHVLRFERDD